MGYRLPLPTSDSVYVVVEHRNHMGVMTPAPVSLTGGVLAHDFRITNSYDGGNGTGSGQKEITSSVWAMYAGDADQFDAPSYDIKGNDKALWALQNGNFSMYTQTDFNMDGDVNGADKGMWENNNGTFSAVPR